jgi:hypothetical protein
VGLVEEMLDNLFIFQSIASLVRTGRPETLRPSTQGEWRLSRQDYKLQPPEGHIDVIQPTTIFKNDRSLVWLEDELDTNEFCPVLLYQSTPSIIFDIFNTL